MHSRVVPLSLALLLFAAGSVRAQPLSPAPPEVVLFSLSPSGPPQPALAGRLRFLEQSLESLAEHDAGRILQGSLQLALGVALGVGAVFVKDTGGRTLLALASGVALGRGSTRLAISTRAQERAVQFAALPADASQQVRRKLEFGEAALAHAARKERRARIIDGSLGMLGAAGVVPLNWASARREDARYRFGDHVFDYVGLSLSVIAFAASLVQTIVKGEAEQRYRIYRELPAE